MARVEKWRHVSKTPEILVDSDVFVAHFVAEDAHHARVVATLAKFHAHYQPLTTTNLVVTETASLLCRRYSFALAVRFLMFLRESNFPVIYIDSDMHAAGCQLFTDVKREGTSLVDCLNVIAVQHYTMSAILSFDRFYQRFGIEQAAEMR